MPTDVDEIMSSAILLIVILSLIAIALMTFFFWLGYWWVNRRSSYCPYVRQRLEPATLLSYEVVERAHEFMSHLNSEENPAFELKHASVCRETGRIFPDTVSPNGVIQVKWDFLQQRFPGRWVSWGSLNEAQQRRVRASHVTLRGYQTEASSPQASPRAIRLPYTLTKPGPLYVDLNNFNLMGWKQVPGTNFEILVVQTPKRRKQSPTVNL